MTRRRLLGLAAALAAGVLVACGRKGPPQKPGARPPEELEPEPEPEPEPGRDG